MELDELKIRLELPTNDISNDQYLIYKLTDAISFVESTTRTSIDLLKGKANSVIEEFVRIEIAGNKGILSESIGGMSQTFESSEARDKQLTDQLRKLGLIKIRVRPIGR